MNSFYDSIEQYLEGELSAADYAAFEAALKEDPKLQEAVEEYRAIIEEINGIKLRQTVKENLQKPVPPGWTGSRLWVFSALIMVSFAVLIWLLLHPIHEVTPANLQSTPIQSNETPIAGQANQDTLLSPSFPKPTNPNQAIDPSTSLAYQEVVDQLEVIDNTLMGDEKKDASLEKLLNQAITLLKSGKSKAAIPLLEKAGNAKNDFYQDDTDWLLALAWLENDPDKSRELLQTIAQNTAHPYRVNALKLLAKMK